MKYEGKTLPAIFAVRENRFVASVWTEDGKEEVHVKNTGRLKELLTPGAMVTLVEVLNEKRSTLYDLVSVVKHGVGWVNVDSVAPNKVMKEWLDKQGFDQVKPEYKYGDSRIDFCLEAGEEKWLVEVKGCTLEKNGVGFFPDAPSERAAKHCRELAKAVGEGWHCAVAFVIPMEGVTEVRANAEQDPAFAKALAEAEAAGVEVWFLSCEVGPDSLEITSCTVKEKQ